MERTTKTYNVRFAIPRVEAQSFDPFVFIPATISELVRFSNGTAGPISWGQDLLRTLLSSRP